MAKTGSTKMSGTEYKRAQSARKAASKWRSESAVYYGYVMVYRGQFVEFCEELPPYKDVKNTPYAVDVNDNVFVKVQARNRWDNIFYKDRTGAPEKESIVEVAKNEMQFCFPSQRDRILKWFGELSCEDGKVRRFENMTLRDIMKVILAGIDINRFLSGRNPYLERKTKPA
jgi:hypothetical protein